MFNKVEKNQVKKIETIALGISGFIGISYVLMCFGYCIG